MREAVVQFFTGLVFWFAGSFFLMIELGAAHSHVSQVPPLGYWATFWIVGAVTSLTSLVGRAFGQGLDSN